MMAFKYPVITITVFLALGILIDSYVSLPGYTLYLLSGTALILTLVSYWHAGRILIQNSYFVLAVYALSVCMGMLLHSIHHPPNNKLHYSYFIEGATTPLIKGVVTERLKPNEWYEKYYFEVSSIDKKQANGKMLISLPIDSLRTQLHAGDKVIISATPLPISKSLNPYQFDYSEYMAKQNVFHQITLRDNYVISGLEANLDYYIGSLRNSLISSFDKHEYSVEVTTMIKALLLGQRQDMDKETNDSYTNAGVVHILAISGLHITVLFYILSLILKPLKRFNAKGRLLSLICVLSFLWLFALLSGLSASVVRSVVMFSFVSIGLYFNRNSNIYNSIAVSMLVLLLAKPNFLFDVGFQLSYAAVFAIVWLQPIYKKIRTSKYPVVNYLSDTILISLVAQIGVLPLTLYYFNQFPLLFLLANMVVIPLSTAVLIIGIIVLLLNFIWADAAIIVGKLLAFLIEIMNGFTRWIASFDSLVLKDIPFTLILNILLYTTIVLAVLWLYKKSYSRTVAALVAVMLFQSAYMVTEWKAANTQELVVFNNRKGTLIATKDRQEMTIYSQDSLVAGDRNIKSYNKRNFNQRISYAPLNNAIWFKGHTMLVIDSLAIYNIAATPEIILLTGSPKLNLERLLDKHKPKQVVADATNYKTYIARWKATCQKRKIPFHATPEKGFYMLH